MAAQKIFNNQKTDGVGTSQTAGADMAVYALTLSGNLGKAYCTVQVTSGGAVTSVGSLSMQNPAKLIMLPAASVINCRLDGSDKDTNVTVVLAS